MKARLVALAIVAAAVGCAAQHDDGAASGAAAETGAGYTVTLDEAADRGAWEGWGTSLAWWANVTGGSSLKDTYADLVFTEKDVPFMGQVLPGLGLNIVRYNIGGGGAPGDVAGLAENVPSQIPWYKNIQGYWRNWDDKDPASASWDFSRDADQRAMLGAAASRGVDHVEFFSNSPMWWMNDSKSNAGGNLQSWNYGDHAHYVASVVAEARAKWGIDVGSVDAFNEPSAGWWNYPTGQEGCNIPTTDQPAVLTALQSELHAAGLDDVAIAASDENSMTEAIATYGTLTQRGVAGAIGKVNVHGYSGLQPWRDNTARQKLRALVGDKRLWMSEYGDSDGSGMALAQTITEDLVNLRPSAWIYWQVVEGSSGWGMVNANYPKGPNDPARAQPTWIYNKYYVMAQFTRFLRPGNELYGTNDHNTVAAYDAANKTLSFVTVNYGNPQTIVYDVTNLAGAGGATEAQVTVTNTAGGKLFQTTRTPLANGKLTISAEANSIYSVQVNVAALR